MSNGLLLLGLNRCYCTFELSVILQKKRIMRNELKTTILWVSNELFVREKSVNKRLLSTFMGVQLLDAISAQHTA